MYDVIYLECGADEYGTLARWTFNRKRDREVSWLLNSFLRASGDFYRLLETFGNSLDPDQGRQNVSSDP